MGAFATTIFAAALLLFVIQPLVARTLLPWYGGSPSVWLVSLLFFQGVLLAGYVYARALSLALDSRRQAIMHTALVTLSLAFLPMGLVRPSVVRADEPVSSILGLLIARMGVPLVLLAATSPLMQTWLVSARLQARPGNVYRLFALSNAGSLLGLWCYPFVLEPWTSLTTQNRLWSGGFALFACATLVSASYAFRAAAPASTHDKLDASASERLMWMGLAAVGAVLLMSTSSQMTQNVAAVPFLWVLPLSLYLLSFIIAFERDHWYFRPLWGGVFVLSVLGILHIVGLEREPPLATQIAVYSVGLLSGCMVCHGELSRRRPAPESLASFYLYVAFGGLVGGLAVSVVAPFVFVAYWEFPIGLVAVLVVGGGAMALSGQQQAFWIVGTTAMTVVVSATFWEDPTRTLEARRNFFGSLEVYDDEAAGVRYLLNGPVTHGGQLLAEQERARPILYYGPSSGVALALDYDLGRRKRVGIVGLGAGSLASFGRPGDRFMFYEINPDVVEMAYEHFYYLADSAADVSVHLGDGRLLLEESEPLELDVLVLDAFTGDAIPVHLLTAEAFAIYQRHLVEDGVLAVHISNLHFALEPVIRARAEAMGAVSVLVLTNEDLSRNMFATDWVLLTTSAEFLSDPMHQALWQPRSWDPDEDLTKFLWSDERSNLFRALR